MEAISTSMNNMYIDATDLIRDRWKDRHTYAIIDKRKESKK